jgi:hypothetical protein
MKYAKEMARGYSEQIGTASTGWFAGRFVRRASKALALLAVSCASIAAVPHGAQAAMVTVVHGINGTDLGLPASLPVDIAVNGTCAIKAVSFTQLTRVELAAGTYSITVHPSNRLCSASPVIRQSVTVPASATAIGLVANLSNAGTPQLAAFVNDDKFAPSITVNNAAANVSIFAGAGPRGWVAFHGNALANGSGVLVLGRPTIPRRANIIVRLFREGVRRPLFNETTRLTTSRVYYVVGSSKSGLQVVIDS